MNTLGFPVYQGSVCDVYSGEYLVLDRTNRITVDGVRYPGEILYKGLVNNQIANHWMKQTAHIVPNQLLATDARTLLALGAKPDQLGRVSAVKCCYPIPFNFVVRGYYVQGDPAWQSYEDTAEICGISLVENLLDGEALEEPIFTPNVQLDLDDHPTNLTFEELKHYMQEFVFELLTEMLELDEEDAEEMCCVNSDCKCTCQSGECASHHHECHCGGHCHHGNNEPEEITFEEYCDEFAHKLCEDIRRISLELYEYVHCSAVECGIIIADANLEFGLDSDMNLVLMGAPFTPDTSRYWNSCSHDIECPQCEIDKHYLRSYLKHVADTQQTEIPEYVLTNVSQIYCDIYHQLTGESVQKLTEDLSYEWHDAQQQLGITGE